MRRRNPNPLRNNHYRASDIGNILGLYFFILIGFFALISAFGELAHLGGH